MAQDFVEEHRTLSLQISGEDFRSLYWLKKELQRFCREQGLPATGGKREITNRIARYLETGERLSTHQPVCDAVGHSKRNAQPRVFSMQSTVPVGFRCSQEARRFFMKHLGPRFRFTVTLQEYIKTHPGITFALVADEWHRQEKLKKIGILRPEIAPQFEYNRFTHDFFADPRNTGKTRADCITAWKKARARRGEHAYHAVGEAVHRQRTIAVSPQ